MIWFWVAAAALAAGSALLVMMFARRAALESGTPDPAPALHRRQLAELDDLADRGLLSEGDRAATRAEAARRLLSSAARGGAPETPGAPASRRIAAIGAVAAGCAALALYMTFGAPGAQDAPYKSRVAAWRRADPATLDAPRMAAVLQVIAAERPSDPEVWGFLGRARLAAGDAFAAERAFDHAARLAPRRADYFSAIGEARLAAMGDKPTSEGLAGAEAAFRHALTLDPKSVPARYALGRAKIAAGDRDGGVSEWRALLADIPTDDPRRSLLSDQVARAAAGRPVDAPAAPPPAAVGAEASVFIRGMVASLAARLQANPNDAEGWARLVRSYGVLHDAPAQADALAKARRQLAGHPEALKAIAAEAQAHPA